MKKIIQSYKTGEIELIECSDPVCGASEILIRTCYSLVSVGTERSMAKLAKKSVVGKARARPDLVKRVLEKVKTEGLIKTYNDVQGRLNQIQAMGYSASGIVESVGKNIINFQKGDFVSVVGANVATHSDIILAPEMLCLKIDRKIGESSAFGMLGVIAMHGIRKANKQPGSVVGVVGLGLLGLLTIKILKAYGYQTIGLDNDRSKVDIAQREGMAPVTDNIDEYFKIINALTNLAGLDAVIITAATDSAGPVNDAIRASRNGGRVVVVGTADINPDRNEMWQKEVDVVVSRASGPGSLDQIYEKEGVDLPIQYARWSQKRNLSEFFRLVESEKIEVGSLITERVNFEKSINLYTSNLLQK